MHEMSQQLFTKKETSERRTIRKVFRVTEEEDKKIRRHAEIRQLDESEFIRRSALGRRADVDMETELVLVLGDITRAVRAMHASYTEHGAKPPEPEMLGLILEARAAIQRISK